jgi:hypothetical protein
MKDWKFNQWGISKEDLPLMVEVNGVTYYSSLKMAKVHNAWYEMGVDDGKSMANSGLTRPDAQNSNEYMKGYKEGESEGYKLAQVEGVANGYTDSDIVRTQEQWYRIGYEAGKKNCSPYIAVPVPEYPNQSTVDYDHDYDDYCKECKDDGISNKEIPGEYLAHIEEAFHKGYKEGYDDCREVKLRKMVEHFAVPSTKDMGSKTWNETIFGSRYIKDCREVAERILKYGRDTDGVE